MTSMQLNCSSLLKIAVVLPSRGIVHPDVIAALDRELSRIEQVRLFSHELPIPICLSYLVEKALSENPTHIWIVEEDTVAPPGALRAMLSLGSDIAAVNYPLKCNPDLLSCRYYDNTLIWVSFGCTLVRHSVFRSLPQPWFKTDKISAISHAGSRAKQEHVLVDRSDPHGYGGHDDYFCFSAKKAGFTLDVVEDMICDHKKMEASK
jgi:hypothetical protein